MPFAKKRSFIAAGLIISGLGSAFAFPAAAQEEFPSETIRVIVPFPPGGGTDFIARLVVERLAEEFPQPVIVENRPGAATIIATEYVRQSPADGHTLLLATNSFVSNAAVTAEAQYDPIEDFEPVMLLGFAPNLLVVNEESPLESIEDIVETAKAEPGSVSFVSYGPASAQLFATRILEQAADVDLQDIPYQGHSGALAAVLSGEVDILFPSITAVLSQVEAGTLKPLAYAASERSPLAPDVPTFQELGYEIEAGTWYGVLAPAGTPEDVVKVLQDAFAEALEDPKVNEALVHQAVEPRAWGSQEFEEMMLTELGQWEALENSN